ENNLTTSTLNPDSWDINVMNVADGETTLVTKGVNPLYAPDGELLVLRSDGIYSFDLSSPTTTDARNIWPTQGKSAASNMKIAISADGEKLVWDSPDEGKIMIENVTSWQPFTVSGTQTLNAYGFWPVVSPDNKYLAFEEVDWGADVPSNPRLVVFNLETGKKT